MITILPSAQRRQLQIAWIVQAVDCFVSTIKNHTDADISSACGVAYIQFINGESGARAIYLGYDHARQLIRRRETQH